MKPAQSLLAYLKELDPTLRVRWAESLGRFSIERKHGRAGDNGKILAYLFGTWKKAEKDAASFPDDLSLDLNARRAWDAFVARRAGCQPIFYLWPNQAQNIQLVEQALVQADVRRFGGALNFWRKVIEREERAEAGRKAQRKERLREATEEFYDRIVAGRKDIHASGSSLLEYKFR